MDLPSLIPTNTRAYERYLHAGGSEWEDQRIYDWHAARLRAALAAEGVTALETKL
jgi:hypothetical protein